VAAIIGPALIAVGLMATGIGSIGTAADWAWPALLKMGVGLVTTVIPAVWSFTVALLANPIGLVVAGVGLLIGALVMLGMRWGWVKDQFVAAWGVIRSVWDGITGAVMSVVSIITWAVDGILGKLRGLLNSIPDWMVTLLNVSTGGGFYAFSKLVGGDDGPSSGAISSTNAGAGGAPRDARVTLALPGLPDGSVITTEEPSDSPLDLEVGTAMVVPV